jgi:hypothetical protein
MKRVGTFGIALVACVAAACSTSSNPLAPGASGTGTTAAGPGGTTLKAGTPTASSPSGDVVVDTLTPTLTITNTRATFSQSTPLGYEIEMFRAVDNERVIHQLIATGSGDTTTYGVPEGVLVHDTPYRWRTRARANEAFGLWSATSNFRTLPPPAPPSVAVGPSDGSVGPTRDIGPNEVLAIIINYHNASRADLGRNSTRESRVAFFWSAMAIVHFGHPQFNPAGGDPGWCVKDAGGGRPPSDDVIVRCGSRDSWDIIGGAGANGYSFHLDYIGRLPGDQNVYPPPRSSLPR